MGLFHFLRSGLNFLFERPSTQIPALDGLRAFAILLVYLSHAGPEYIHLGGQGGPWVNSPLIHSAWVGVDLFFVLSGFLIGKQLWAELEKHKRIDFWNFIWKRGLRIWPLYFFFLTAIYLLLGVYRPAEIWPEVVFLSNYLGQSVIRGSWSLATEEQFYILFPLTLMFFSRFASGHRFWMAFLIVGLIAAPVWRLATIWYFQIPAGDTTKLINYLYYPFHTHYDTILMGVALAKIYQFCDTKEPQMQRKMFALLGGLVILCFGLRAVDKVLFNYSFLAALFGFFLWYGLHRKDWVTRLLSLRPLYLVSRLSFGIYLVHYAVLRTANFDSLLFSWLGGAPHFVTYVVVTFAVCVLITMASFVLVEAPFLKNRSRIIGAILRK